MKDVYIRYIKWDCDEDCCDLPSELEIEVPNDCDTREKVLDAAQNALLEIGGDLLLEFEIDIPSWL